MKRLSIGLPAIALVMTIALSGAAFTTAPATPANNNNGNTIVKPRYTGLHVPFVKQKFEYIYYWFAPDDTYNDWETLSYEEWEMGFYYPGYVIDNNAMGGTLIEKGYMMPGLPHQAYPQTYLFVHY